MKTAEQQFKLDAKWTDDCQGKKDYDGEILSISTRYWPRGGGFHVFDRDNPKRGFQGNEARPQIRPSAQSQLVIYHAESGYLTLVEQEFEAETQEEVQAQVEAWAQAQMDRAVAALQREFGE